MTKKKSCNIPLCCIYILWQSTTHFVLLSADKEARAHSCDCAYLRQCPVIFVLRETALSDCQEGALAKKKSLISLYYLHRKSMWEQQLQCVRLSSVTCSLPHRGWWNQWARAKRFSSSGFSDSHENNMLEVAHLYIRHKHKAYSYIVENGHMCPESVVLDKYSQ